MRLACVLALVCAVSACAPAPADRAPADRDTTRSLGDSVMVPVPGRTDADMLGMLEFELLGGAKVDTITVGEAAVLRAETPQQAAAAQRATASSMYLGDPYHVLRMRPATDADAVAILPDAVVVGTPISVEMLVRITGPGFAPVLRFEHAAPKSGAGDRRMPSAVAFELLPSETGEGYDRARILLGAGDDWSTQEEIPLADADWRGYAHRIGLVIARDHVGLVVDGNAVIEQPARLYGPPTHPRGLALAGAPDAEVTVLQWTIDIDD